MTATRYLARLVSASGLTRAMICVASAVLPQVASAHSRADLGNSIHGFLETVDELGRETALANVAPEHRAACEAIDLTDVPIGGLRFAQEVAIALDVVTGRAREIGRSIGRNYGEIAPSELVGTADVIALSADGTRVYVWDYKTGRGEVTKARRNWQLRFLAVAACRLWGAVEATVWLIHVPAADEEESVSLPPPSAGDTEVRYDRATFDALDIDGFEVELREFYGRLAKARLAAEAGNDPPATTGSHCHYCSSISYCRAQMALVRPFVADPEEAAAGAGALDPTSPEAAAVGWMKIKALRVVVGMAEKALMAYAATHPFTLPSGVVVGEVVEPGVPKYDAAIVRRELTTLFGADVAERACDFETSGAAIDRALKPLAKKRGDMKAMKTKVEKALGEAKAISRKPTRRVKEHVPRELATAEIKELADIIAAGGSVSAESDDLGVTRIVTTTTTRIDQLEEQVEGIQRRLDG